MLGKRWAYLRGAYRRRNAVPDVLRQNAKDCSLGYINARDLRA